MSCCAAFSNFALAASSWERFCCRSSKHTRPGAAPRSPAHSSNRWPVAPRHLRHPELSQARQSPRGRHRCPEYSPGRRPAATLGRLAYRINAIGFVAWTFTLVAGAIWADHAWGRPWGWDPKETWAFVIWVIYAAYLHARVTTGWAAEKFACFAIIGFMVGLTNFYIVYIFFSRKHSDAGL